MSNCLNCELTRAKLIAATMQLFGCCGDKIAAFLKDQEGEHYYFENGAVWRKSKLAPYEPHLIRMVEK
jgi:hypothetical protein